MIIILMMIMMIMLKMMMMMMMMMDIFSCQDPYEKAITVCVDLVV